MQEVLLDPLTDGTNPSSDLPLFRTLRMLREASRITGREFTVEVNTFKNQMAKAGFTEVEETKIQIPLGPWHADPNQKEIGRYFLALRPYFLQSGCTWGCLLKFYRYNMLCFLEGIEAYTLALFTRVLGMDVEEVRDLLAKSYADIRNKKLRIYFWL